MPDEIIQALAKADPPILEIEVKGNSWTEKATQLGKTREDNLTFNEPSKFKQWDGVVVDVRYFIICIFHTYYSILSPIPLLCHDTSSPQPP